MLPEKMIEDLLQRQECFDQLCSAWAAEYRQRGGSVYCGKGCSGCCSLVVNCTFPEAVIIARTLNQPQKEKLYLRVSDIKMAAEDAGSLKDWLSAYRRDAGPCPFLEAGGACGVYSVRPISCRSLFSTKHSEWCTADFAALSSQEKQLFIETLDRSAVAFPTHYAATPQEIGRELEEATLRQMEAEFGFGLLGCLRWLVWLELEHGLSERLHKGREALQEYLEKSGVSNVYLAAIV